MLVLKRALVISSKQALNASDTSLDNVSPASLSCRQQNWFSAQPVTYPVCLPSYLAVLLPLQRFPSPFHSCHKLRSVLVALSAVGASHEALGRARHGKCPIPLCGASLRSNRQRLDTCMKACAFVPSSLQGSK